MSFQQDEQNRFFFVEVKTKINRSMSSAAVSKNPLQPWIGTWKRTCAQESFGPFVRQRDSVTFVTIEDVSISSPLSTSITTGSSSLSTEVYYASPSSSSSSSPSSSNNTPLTTSLKWSFGANLDTLRHGYTLSLPQLVSSQSGLGGISRGWKKAAITAAVGEGVVRDDGNCISLQLFGASFASIVYRMIDEDTCSVTITELPTPLEGERLSALEVRDKSVASVQHGYMFRVQ